MLNAAHVIFLDKNVSQPKLQVGELTLQLARLKNKGLPIIDSFVIPVGALNEIATANTLKEKLQSVFELTDWNDDFSLHTHSQNIQHIIKNLIIPQHIAQSILKAHQKMSNDQHLVVKPSQLYSTQSSPNQAIVAKGNANLAHAVLEAWAQLYQPNSLQTHFNYFQQGHVVPAAILVQKLPNAAKSGYALSRHPRTDQKHIYVIKSGYGVKSKLLNESALDHIEFDIRHQQVTNATPSIKSQKYILSDQGLHLTSNKKAQARLSLDQANIESLVALIKKAKLTQLEHIYLEWLFENGKPYLTALKTIKSDPTTTTSSDSSSNLHGTPIVPGSINGETVNDTQLDPANKNMANLILVCPKISYHHLKVIDKVGGIILKSAPSQAISQILRSKAIPTLLVRNEIFERIPQNQLITLDASLGKIKIHQRLQNSYNQTSADIDTAFVPHKKKILVTGGNPATSLLTDVQPADGLLFQSEYVLDYLKLNSQDLLEKKHQTKFQAKAREFIDHYFKYHSSNLYYRSLPATLHTNETEAAFLPNISLLNMEFDLLKKVQTELGIQPIWIPNLVRTANELSILAHLLKEYNAEHKTSIKLWMEVDTLENVLAIENYTSNLLAGLLINYKKLHEALYQIDATEPMAWSNYPIDKQLLYKLVKQTKEHLTKQKTNIALFIILDSYTQDLVQQLGNYVDGFVSKPQQVGIIRQLVQTK